MVVIMLQSASLLRTARPATLKLFTAGLLLYGTAFLLWNIDNEFCPVLERVRAASPGPLRPLTQLHGWWHVLVGG